MPLPKYRKAAEDYWGLPRSRRAELIDGELWDLAAPSRVHQFVQAKLISRFISHIEEHDGSCQVYGSPFAVNLFSDDTTFVEPDVSVVCDPSKLSERGCEGAPDLVVEIVSPSSRHMDYRTKQDLYDRAGVREYWAIDPSMERTTVFRFESDPAPMIYPFAKPVSSQVLPGFEVKIEELLDTL